MTRVSVVIVFLMFSAGLFGCSIGGDTTGDGEYIDGTYTGTGQGYGGEIRVLVEIANGQIQSVNIEEHSESEEIADPALDQIPSAIVEEQSTDVDNVSGATATSEGIKDAVEDSLEEAR
ncbi:FMN-binding protein [Proteinivorax hydrogeniformans]|uniref:FMN-binding protein n=1 Tax=Proteinivorax hydrogeniformans TaxID=1826727 RepID=A0AAU8HW87_9FIRM